MSASPYPLTLGEADPLAARRTIPFDHTFSYELTGVPDRTHSKTVRISIEGPFTATSIGYGVVPRPMPLRFGPNFKSDFETGENPGNPGNPTSGNPGPSERSPARPAESFFGPGVRTLRAGPVTREFFRFPGGGRGAALSERPVPRPEKGKETTPKKLSEIPLSAIMKAFRRVIAASPRFLKGEAGLDEIFRSGFRLSPATIERALLGDGNVPLDAEELAELFEVVTAPAEQVLFLYSLHDEGTGRAFQSDPVLSIAGLGISNGDRPFRQFATPILFAPHTTIRLDVTEKSEFVGQLHIALQGYKMLGTPGTPTAVRRR
jgi:hypothetical protein